VKEFVEYIVKELVDNTLDVSVNEISGEKAIVYKVSVGEGELGKVIGKRGQTAHAIRTILNAIASKQGKRAVLEILDQ
jgi:hypothetical protein